jgi:hypothetical protein
MLTSDSMVLVTAVLATFVGSVMGEEQNERLRNGGFGAVAGTSLGGVAALLTNETALLLVGAFGSAIGACAGWFVYLGLCWGATTKTGSRLLEFHVSGLKGVRERLDSANEKVLLSALDRWTRNFSRLQDWQKSEVLCGSIAPRDSTLVKHLIREWLVTITDVFNLMFEALAREPGYCMRVTILVYVRLNGGIVGKHWISYAGQLAEHRTLSFNDKSIGYKVLIEEQPSPFFTTLENANSTGQNRGTKDYVSFLVMRLNEYAVLSVDWPGALKEDHPYVKVAKDLYQLEVAPAIRELLAGLPSPSLGELGRQASPDDAP